MASGFIIFEDGRCFARRWTVYDIILKLLAEEIYKLEKGKSLANWLTLQVPTKSDDETEDAGWGFYSSREAKWINRSLDLRSFTVINRQLFNSAIPILKSKSYENLTPFMQEQLSDFYKMYQLCEAGAPPLEFSDWGTLAEPCIEKNGPGWK